VARACRTGSGSGSVPNAHFNLTKTPQIHDSTDGGLLVMMDDELQECQKMLLGAGGPALVYAIEPKRLADVLCYQPRQKSAAGSRQVAKVAGAYIGDFSRSAQSK